MLASAGRRREVTRSARHGARRGRAIRRNAGARGRRRCGCAAAARRGRRPRRGSGLRPPAAPGLRRSGGPGKKPSRPIPKGISKGPMEPPWGLSACRKSGLRHFFEVFIAPLRLRRGQGAMQGNPCYARLFADLTRMSPNPIKASGGCGPRTPGGFSTGWLFFSPSPQKGYIPSRTFWNIHSQKHCFALARMVALMGTWQLSCRMKSPAVMLAI